MVAFTLTATTVFAHQDETGKGGAEQKAQKEVKQDDQLALQESETQAEECDVEYKGNKASCTYCNCRRLLRTLIREVERAEKNK